MILKATQGPRTGDFVCPKCQESMIRKEADGSITCLGKTFIVSKGCGWHGYRIKCPDCGGTLGKPCATPGRVYCANEQCSWVGDLGSRSLDATFYLGVAIINGKLEPYGIYKDRAIAEDIIEKSKRRGVEAHVVPVTVAVETEN